MENFPGIRFIGNEALTLLAQSIVPHNRGNVEIVRVNPEDMQSPQIMTLIGEGLNSFPSRVASVLSELSTMHDHKNGNEVFECGQQLLAIKDETLLAIFRREFDSKYNAGKVDEAVQLFEKYAQRLVSGSTNEQIFEGMQAGFMQLDIKGSSDTSKQQEVMITKALQVLPEDLVNACNNLGVAIVVKEDTYASSLFANRTISVSPECFERGQQDLERALKEEMIHYVDSFIRFTHRPQWHDAAKKALGELSSPADAKDNKLEDATPEQLIEMVQSGEIGVEELERAIAMLDQKIRTAHSHVIGKNSIDTYAPHVRHAELLPDIVHALDVAHQERLKGGQDTYQELREIYGDRAIELVGDYWHEVKEVAENKHPALQADKREERDFAANVSVKRKSSFTEL